MKPPTAKKIPHEIAIHGETRVDDYYWLRERDNPDVLAYLNAENTYAEGVMEQSEGFRQKLYIELVGRIKETDVSAPEQIDDYYYYSRTEEGKQYSIHCRRRGTLDAEEEILIDENVLAEGRAYFDIGVFKVSPDHRLLAYSADFDGDESYTLYIKNLDTGELYAEAIPNTYYGVEWANDNRTLFYNTLDDAQRPYKLFRHRLGTPQEDDTLVFHERNDGYFLGLSKTKSRRFLILRLRSNTTTEVHLIEAGQPGSDFKIVHRRQPKTEYYLAHGGEWLYVLTNDGAKNFKLMKAPVADPGKENWKTVIRHRKKVKIDDVEVFKRHLVVYERENGLKKIRIVDLESDGYHYVSFPEPVYTFDAGANPVFDTGVLRFTYSSLTTPRSVYDYDMDKRERVLVKRYEVLGGYDPAEYRCERVFAVAGDGSKIPISLVYRKGTVKDRNAPLVLYGYGAYGSTVEPHFLSYRLSLLDRGFVFAIAHVRGGGELGRHWYEQGKLLSKQNTFSDFIACAEHLIRRKYTSKGKIAIAGGSAGGLLMGAVTNLRPDLFRCVTAHVPFVDVVTTMLDRSLPLTVVEFEEWGNPAERKFYEYLLSYSPLDNVISQEYPNMLVTAGLNDPRVPYWEPAKWVAKLRTTKTDENLLLLRTKLGEGHSGASGRYDYLRDLAFEYAFLFRCFGITE
jgi:oligopeptidase B